MPAVLRDQATKRLHIESHFVTKNAEIVAIPVKKLATFGKGVEPFSRGVDTIGKSFVRSRNIY